MHSNALIDESYETDEEQKLKNNTSMQFLECLNSEQYKAVIASDDPLLVLSGAGTGKTKVLTSKIAYLIEKGFAYPSQILAVTFSNRAAREMKDRLSTLSTMADSVWLGTFHSICARILRVNAEHINLSQQFTIIDSDDQEKIIKHILKELNLDVKMASGVISKINRWKDKCISYNDQELEFSTAEAKIYSIYQQRLMSYDSVDFADLLLYVIKLFKNNQDVLQKYRSKFKYILVDEYQDTNMAQYYWLRMLSPTGRGLCCVGDDDQAIYSWRGAEVGNILRFDKDFINTNIIRLEENYRSYGHILGAASSLISHNKTRLGKTIWTKSIDGEKVGIFRAYNGFEEAKFVVEKIEEIKRKKNIKYGDFAILVRAGFQTREFEEKLIAYGLPYRVIGGLKFYDRQEIKDILAYMRLIYQLNDGLAFERIINTPKRGIGASALSKIHECAKENGVSLFVAAKHLLSQTGSLRVSLHQSLSNFVDFIEEFHTDKHLRPHEIAKKILEVTGYLQMLSSENTLESQGRIENLRELLIALEDFSSLGEFIEHVSLVTESKNLPLDDLVSVMTLHSAKGLEYNSVFLTGWEDGIFPHNLSLQENNVEEERRLAYVGITRGRETVYITYAMNRRIYNQWQSNPPSRFLKEIAEKHTVYVL